MFICSSACVVQVNSVLLCPLPSKPQLLTARQQQVQLSSDISIHDSQIILKSEVITEVVQDINTKGSERLTGT